MNLNPIFVTLFDHDGWPLCPKCQHALRTNTIHSDGYTQQKPPATCTAGTIADMIHLAMQRPLVCDRCCWKTPRRLDPAHTLNLAAVPTYIQLKWMDQGHGLPSTKFQRVLFDSNPHDPKAKCWAIHFGYN